MNHFIKIVLLINTLWYLFRFTVKSICSLQLTHNYVFFKISHAVKIIFLICIHKIEVYVFIGDPFFKQQMFAKIFHYTRNSQHIVTLNTNRNIKYNNFQNIHLKKNCFFSSSHWNDANRKYKTWINWHVLYKRHIIYFRFDMHI